MNVKQIVPGTLLRTRYGSLVEAITYPDTEGWLRVKRLSDGATRDWNLSQLHVETVTRLP